MLTALRQRGYAQILHQSTKAFKFCFVASYGLVSLWQKTFAQT